MKKILMLFLCFIFGLFVAIILHLSLVYIVGYTDEGIKPVLKVIIFIAATLVATLTCMFSEIKKDD